MSGQRLRPEACFQIAEFAFGATACEPAAFQGRDAGGIVTAVFEALQRIDQLICDRTAPQNSDNAAHAGNYLQDRGKIAKKARAPLNDNRGTPGLNNYCRLRQG
jgi:hypothetical protein